MFGEWSSVFEECELGGAGRSAVQTAAAAVLWLGTGMSTAVRNREPEPRRMSLAEWAAMPEDEPGEIVDGVLVEEEVPEYLHELIVVWLGQLLRNWGAPRGALVAGSGAKFAVRPNRGRMPDLTVFLAGGPRPPKRGLIAVPPTIAIEVVSASPCDERRDRVEKLVEYAAFGIKWYWIVDPELRSVEVLELGPDGRYAHAAAVTEDAIDPVPGCEGLRFDVCALWAEMDALDEA
ncbi:MAG: Uma2 family endonuclease [Polyangiaceae bacterium]